MSRKRRAQRPSHPASAPAQSGAGAPSDPTDAADQAVTDGAVTDQAPASMRDAMRAALDAKASRQGQVHGSGPRAGSDGPAGRGGGAKGFRALPRRSAG